MIVENLLARLENKKFFPRGVHPREFKEPSREQAITPVPWPAEVVIPLHQHIGAPAEPAVKTRTEVKIGDLLGKSAGFVSANVHASVNGATAAVTAVIVPTGMRVPAVPIKTKPVSDEELREQLKQYLTGAEGATPVDRIDPEAIADAAYDAGLVGMGGATFPTHVKLKVGPEKRIDTVLLNGSECEPYLTADDRLMREAPHVIIRGLLLAMRAAGAARGVIAIEDNKPEAIEAMTAAQADHSNIELAVCATKYPMGGERQLVPAVLNRTVPTAGLPLDVGVVVINVATALSLAHAVDRGRPLTHRVVTVTGAVRRPSNFFVPIGTPIGHLIEQAGGLTDEAGEVVMGGPMMGVTVPDLTIPVVKGTSGITVLSKAQLDRRMETACVRCGRCVDVCPLHLTPTKIAHAVKFRDLQLAESYDLMACCECGCCAYVCPAKIPLVQYLKSGKAEVMRERARKKAAANSS